MHRTLKRSAYWANKNPLWHIISLPVWFGLLTRWSWKYPQNGSLKHISTFLLTAGLQGTLMKTQFGLLWRAVFTNCSCSCPQLGSFYNLAAEPDRELLELQIWGNVHAKLESRRPSRLWEPGQGLTQLVGDYVIGRQNSQNFTKVTKSRVRQLLASKHSKASKVKWFLNGPRQEPMRWSDRAHKQ